MTDYLKKFAMLACLFLCATSVDGRAEERTALKIMVIAWADVGVQENVFLDELTLLGYDVRPEFFAAKMDRTALATFLRTSLEARVTDFDFVYTFGTTASLMTQSIVKNRVPHLFNAVYDPIGSGLVSSLTSTGLNLNGFSDGIPVKTQVALLKRALSFKSIGFIFNPREPNSNLERQKFKAYCDEFGITFIDIRVTQEPGQLEAALADIKNKKTVFDLAVLPQDSFVATNQKVIFDTLLTAKIPTFGTIKDYHNSGALLVMTPNFEAGGRRLARMLHDHLQGILLSQTPVLIDHHPEVLINEATARSLGLLDSLRAALLKQP